MYITKPVWSHVLALRLWTLKKAQLPGSLSPDYTYLNARQITHQLSFHSQTIPDCIRYIIGVSCCNFKSQTNILCFILTHWLLLKRRYSPLLIHWAELPRHSNVYILSLRTLQEHSCLILTS